MSAQIVVHNRNGFKEYTLNGYTATVAKPTSPMICPHCGFEHEDATFEFCVLGRPDNSISPCDSCGKPFGVVVEDGCYYVVKLYSLDDNIN